MGTPADWPGRATSMSGALVQCARRRKRLVPRIFKALCCSSCGDLWRRACLPVASVAADRDLQAGVLLGVPLCRRRSAEAPLPARQALARVPPRAQLPRNRRPLQAGNAAMATPAGISSFVTLMSCPRMCCLQRLPRSQADGGVRHS